MNALARSVFAKTFTWNKALPLEVDGATSKIGRENMKKLVICAGLLTVALSPAAQAKGCIKGAIVGGVAGHMAGHGKVGAAAGCVIGHHEANKAGAEKTGAQGAAKQ
jgi:uncharacterized protein YcfJ